MPKSVRFNQISELRGDTKIMGATAAEWDAALTGNMARTLQEVKRLAESGIRRDISTATTLDVASTASKHLHRR